MTHFQDARDVMLVEDDDELRHATEEALELAGLEPQSFPSAAKALARIHTDFAGCVVTDIRMDGMDGLALMAAIHQRDREIPVILITGHGDVAMAVAALKDGAFDFLAKPFSNEQLMAAVRRALQARALVLENRALRRDGALSADEIVGTSAAIEALRIKVGQLAMLDLDVLIEGESGSGKEIVAQTLHRRSARALMPFVVVRCSALGESSPRLFSEDGTSLVDGATGGVLFLSEIEALPATLQARMLSFLEERDRAPENGPRPPRVIVASRTALDDAVREGRMREDLYYRLSVIRLRVPPLRERREDIPAMFARFVGEAIAQTRVKHFEMSASDRRRLLEYDWPGNSRELRNYAFSAVLGLQQKLPGSADPSRQTLSARMAAVERTLILEAIDAAGWNVSQACTMLGVSRQTLYEKIAKHNIPLAGRRDKE